MQDALNVIARNKFSDKAHYYFDYYFDVYCGCYKHLETHRRQKHRR